MHEMIFAGINAVFDRGYLLRGSHGSRYLTMKLILQTDKEILVTRNNCIMVS